VDMGAQATRLVIFLSEDDRIGNRGLHEALLERAREDGMAGATVWRGVEGFGSSGRLRTARFPDVSAGLPLAVELIDTPERIEGFVSVVKRLAPGSLVTRESVQMWRPVQGRAPALDDPGPDSGGHRS
jgi:PII-like signaling protein